MRKFLGLTILVLCSSNAAPQDAQNDPQQAIFISDLHMGVGRDPKDNSQWHAMEDFRWHVAFDNFLRKMVAIGNGHLELIILGDFLELWQSLENDCENQRFGRDLGCSEVEVLKRMDRVLHQHHEVFSSLSWFATQGNNSVIILAGNHDVGLAFSSARNKLMQAFDTSARDRIRIDPKSIWISNDGRIAAEHGQQIGSDPNKFADWPDRPFVDKDGVRYLVQPWGESFVQDLFNDVEETYPIVDNISAEMAGFRYAYKSASLKGKIGSAGKALRFLFTQMSWDQAKQILGADGIPEWKIIEKQQELQTNDARWQFLVQSLDVNDPLRIALEISDETPQVPEFDLDEIEAICDRRWIQEKANVERNIDLCESTGQMGAGAERVGEIINPKARNKRFRKYFDSLRNDGTVGDVFAKYVYGHTHKVEIAYAPYGSEADGVTVYNDGAWQRTVSAEHLCTIARMKGWSDAQILEKAKPEDLPACYPFVVARWGGSTDDIHIQNLYWNEDDQSGYWHLSCSAAPRIDPECL